ncbi:MAG: BACON domain-containing protein, partial [Ilumatobacteraceae bacterium]
MNVPTANYQIQGGTGSVYFAAQNSCTWQPTSSASWLTITSPGTVTGTTTVQYQVSGNTSGSARSATITAQGMSHLVTQCGLSSFSSDVATFGAAGGTGSLSFMLDGQQCTWAATSNRSWLVLTSPTSGQDGGTIAYSVAANPTAIERSGAITVAGQVLTVTQAGIPCAFTSLLPATAVLPASGGTGSVGVGTNGGSCAWQATSSASWLTITSGGSGSAGGSAGVLWDNGPVITHPGAGFGGADASAISADQVELGLRFNVASLSPTDFHLADDFVVPAGGWNVSSLQFIAFQQYAESASAWAALFVRIWDGPPGDGGTVIWGDMTTNVLSSVTILGAYRVRPYSLGENSYPMARLEAGNLDLNLPPGTYWVECAAKPTDHPSTWVPQVSLPSGTIHGNARQYSSLTGIWSTPLDARSARPYQLPFIVEGISAGGTIEYAALPNPGGASRTATITAGGLVHTVTQWTESCEMTGFNDPSASFTASGGTGDAVILTNGADCGWEVASSEPWLVLTGESSGSGGGGTSNVLWDNGPLVTHPGGGFGGADASRAWPSGLLGFLTDYSQRTVADDFVVTGGGVTITGIRFFGYEPNSSTASTYLGLYVRIWDGPPWDGGEVVWGDLATNLLTSSEFSNVYRVSQSNMTSNSRPIMNLDAEEVEIELDPGTYWIEFATDGNGGWQGNVNQSFCPLVSSPDVPMPGNAWYSVPFQAGDWRSLQAQDGPQALPFILTGTRRAGAGLTYEVLRNPDASPRSAEITAGGHSHVVMQAASECAIVSLSPESASISSDGGSGTVAITTNGGGCGWQASSDSSWLTITSGATGTGGSGVIAFSVAPNPGAEARSATITAGDQTHVVTQQPAAPSSFDAFVGEVSALTVGGVDYSVIDVYAQFVDDSVVVVNAYDAAISNANGSAFRHHDGNTISGEPGTWMASSSIDVGGANSAIDSFVTIGGLPGSINTTGFDPTFTPPTAPVPPANGGWFNSNPPNLQGLANPTTRRTFLGRFVVESPAGGDVLTFTASITYAVYSGGATGSPQFATDTVSVSYPSEPCSALTANASSTMIGSGGTSSPVSVSVDVVGSWCSWTASSSQTWLVLAGASGSGDGNFSFTVSANPSTFSRSATITVSSGVASDATITITQSAAPCIVNGFTPSTAAFASSGGTGSTTISTNGGNCGWTATSSASWLAITSGASGSGESGSIEYSVASNPSATSRTATITA